MKRILVFFALSMVLLGCDAASDMKEIFNKQEAAQNYVKEKYGWQSQLGFNIHNGVLSQVTLILRAEDVRNESVSHLEEIAREVVSASFKSTPKVVYIQIVTTASEDS